jgi:hypothetical protein
MDLRNQPQDSSIAGDQAAESAPSSKDAASTVQIDQDASAALASAIASAKRGVKAAATPASAEPANSEPAAAHIVAGAQGSSRSYLARAAAASVLIGSCWFASYAGTLANRDTSDQTRTEMARSEETMAKLGGELEAVKSALAALTDTAGASSRAEASDSAKLAEKIERLALALRDPGLKLSAMETRLDRMENQIMTALADMTPKAPIPSATEAAIRDVAPAPAPPTLPTPTPVAATPVAAPPAPPAPPVKQVKNEPIDGWVVREVYDGAALVEGQNRRLYEVVPGGVVPGVGRVEAIERRGSRWVVLTDKGIIGTYR